MWASSKKCEKGKAPKVCSPEQIKECHGDVERDHCLPRDTQLTKQDA
jgi:hypothetical protein